MFRAPQARAEGKENLLRASHQSCLEERWGETRRQPSRLNEETGRWSLESAIMFQNLILSRSQEILFVTSSVHQRGDNREGRAHPGHSRSTAGHGSGCQGPFCTPPQKEGSRAPTAARLPWNIGGQPGSQRAGYSFPRNTPWPILVVGQLRPEKRSLGWEEGKHWSELWPWQVFCPCVVIPGPVSPSFRWPRRGGLTGVAEDAEARAWAGLMQQRCSVVPGPSAAPSGCVEVGAGADGEIFQPWGAQQAGAVVGEGAQGELAVVVAHPAAACRG